MRYFATYLIYLAVLARALGWSQDNAPIPIPVWVLLAIFGVILFTEQVLTRRLTWYPRVYTLVQSGLVIAMFFLAPTLDILALLFLPLSFQAVAFFNVRIGFVWIGGFSVAMISMFLFGLEQEAGLTMVLANSGANALMGSFAHLMARTENQRQENQRMLRDLQVAYSRLKDSATQAEALATVEERHRLVRELHDSLTQTLFSMNLAVQSAQLSVDEAPHQVDEHLLRLQTLARSAVREVQALTRQVTDGVLSQGGLAQAIRRLAEDRMAQDGLQVILEVTGQRSFPEPVEIALYRIVQETLNNIVRHAGTRQAWVLLQLENPQASLEVVDKGCGFDLETMSQSRGYGLTGMAERASEVDWELKIESQPGQGTRIRVVEKIS